MTHRFEIIVHTVSQDDAATIIQALKGSAKLISVTAVPDEKPPQAAVAAAPAPEPLVLSSSTPWSHYRHGQRNKGIKGPDLLIKILSDGAEHDKSEIAKIFVDHNFALSSSSPAISEHVRAGVVVVLPNGRVKLATLPKEHQKETPKETHA